MLKQKLIRLAALAAALIITSGFIPEGFIAVSDAESAYSLALYAAGEAEDGRYTVNFRMSGKDSLIFGKQITAGIKALIPAHIKTKIRPDFFTNTQKLTVIIDDTGYLESKERAKLIIDEIIAENMDQREKIRAIYNHLVTTGTYDHASAGRDRISDAHRAYGALIEGRAVCSGFADAFMMLCKEAGIPCVYITGSMENAQGSINHAWNMVYTGEDWYFIDTSSAAAMGEEFYNDYFLMTRETMPHDYKWDESLTGMLISSGRVNSLMPDFS